MRVAIYARVSTDAQEARGTIGSQLESLRERVAAEGHELVASYVDDGFSGARLDRPGLDGLRDAAEAGEIEALWCLTPDRLSRSYAYQVLIADELARHGIAIRYLDAPDIASDPQARLLTQVQSVIAEYERAKISERSRRGKLYRARAGEAVHWRAPFGYVRVPRQGERAAHLVVNEEQAALVRRIFADYTTGGLSLRQITLALNAEGVPTPEGKRWITSTLGRMLKREAYVGRAWVNTTKMVDDRGPGRRPRQVPRPRSEWIAVPCPRIVDDATFEAAAVAGRDNTNFSARRLDPDEQGWLLRGLVFCACGTRSIVDRGNGASPTGIRYYACRNRCGLTTEERRCRLGGVRADALDEFVFGEIRAALASPALLLAGERAVAARGPVPDDELLAAELARLERRLDSTAAERRRVADLYQAGVLDPAELARRADEIEQRRGQLASRRESLLAQRQELTADNRLRRRIDSFADRATAAIDGLDFAQRQRLVRLLVERVDVRGWHLDIQLRIPLDDPEGPGPGGTRPPTSPPQAPLSSEDRLRRIGHGGGVAVRKVAGVDVLRRDVDSAPVGELDLERSVVRRLHSAPAAVEQPEAVVVAQRQHLVALGERTSAGLEDRLPQLATRQQQLAGPLVEVAHGRAAGGDHQDVVAFRPGGVPVADEAVSQPVGVVGSHHPP